LGWLLGGVAAKARHAVTCLDFLGGIGRTGGTRSGMIAFHVTDEYGDAG